MSQNWYKQSEAATERFSEDQVKNIVEKYYQNMSFVDTGLELYYDKFISGCFSAIAPTFQW